MVKQQDQTTFPMKSPQNGEEVMADWMSVHFNSVGREASAKRHRVTCIIKLKICLHPARRQGIGVPHESLSYTWISTAPSYVHATNTIEYIRLGISMTIASRSLICLPSWLRTGRRHSSQSFLSRATRMKTHHLPRLWFPPRTPPWWVGLNGWSHCFNKNGKGVH